MGFLTDIVDRVRRELDRNPLPDGELLARAASMPPPRGFAEALGSPSISLIAEVKRASPSAGTIVADPGWDPGTRAAAYERGGAAAVSVLTEPRHFGGSLADLRSARLRTSLPVLRKDFVVHPSQVIEARAAGADAVLLIAAVLTESELMALLATAADLGLDCLVETHGTDDLERTLAAGAPVVGVNARDLETLAVDPGRALATLARVPPDRVRVLESGVRSAADVRRAEEAGAAAVLVGEALMRADDPAAAAAALLGR